MPFRFVCEHCGQTLRVSSRKIGKRETCPNCKQAIVVPNESEGERQIKAREAARKEEEAANAYSEFVVYDHDTEMVYEVDDQDNDPGHINRDKVSIPRYMLYAQGALLGVIGLAAFVFGIFVGQGTRTGPTAAERDKPIVLKGTITYQTATKPRPDDGAVVIILPADAKAERGQKIPLPYLAPEAPLPVPSSQPLMLLKELRGIYARADTNGDYRVELPKRGEYLVLYLSHNGAARPDNTLLDADSKNRRKQDLANLGDIFEGGNDMVEQRGYVLRKEKFNTDTELDMAFLKGS